MSYPLVIEPSVFARESKTLQGNLPIADLPRVLDSLAESGGAVSYWIEGRISERERPQLFLRLDGVFSLRCQRCLESVAYPLQVRNLLEFVGDESRLTQEEIEDDSRDFLPWKKEIDVVALLEDEIILALPPAPRHEQCNFPDLKYAADVNMKSSPFSMLRELKGKITQ